ncbi:MULTISPECIES: hypothetical protein [unclassified Candidatus Frackibacter]|uniref:hypothetical protein n=1 Tax=unclassified Candidatus Frackibacter TaxID=2648818 RepID=UPI000881B087|nr:MULTISPECIES: hypothetical protein [unclassified Candidatus Frackibacter]SDC00421.1 hypothetical protein SAMN04515661_101239 [Candidatus Frackibacter sp. WG11]SEM31900.1 hypothetical protein SAMN04488698_101239 [Candidatus Frackibacter sp. WG12]SFL36799.1 hypothetical protein SAMN04488699_101239 [Candidatus Frackibacter sp. WG13]
MGKVFIGLDEDDQLQLERICLDKDPQEALEFILEKVAPKVEKQEREKMKHPTTS